MGKTRTPERPDKNQSEQPLVRDEPPARRMLDYRILVAAMLERDTAARELCGAMGTAGSCGSAGPIAAGGACTSTGPAMPGFEGFRAS
jgi:hypothetical protein